MGALEKRAAEERQGGAATLMALERETATTLHATLLFHLNLNYSSIEVEVRPLVVERCYGPMLDLLDELPWLALAVEAPAHTLELVAAIDPDWLARLRAHVAAGRVELVGSGDTQLIGPLVPAGVNGWNQRLGQERYEELVGVRPTTALVNEMAWSQGLVDAYLDAGYARVCMEWNNPRRTHPEWRDEWRYQRVRTASPSGREIELLWTDTIAFQKLQRAASGDLSAESYLSWLRGERGEDPRHVFLYANDAEVFDFRPGRYRTEPPLEPGDGEADAASEWRRVVALLEGARELGVELVTPARVFADEVVPAGPCLTLTSAEDPIPVKKQPKYNVTRWAVSGRDDVGLNTRCFERAHALEAADETDPDAWRALCRAWASDRRTHFTDARWEALPEVDRPVAAEDARFAVAGPPTATSVDRDGRWLELETSGVRCVLDLRRGLAIESLAFDETGPAPLVGTLRHGAFDAIDWAADFYTGHVVLEMPAQGKVADLQPVVPEVRERSDRIELRASVPTPLGELPERVTVFADRVELFYGLSAWGARPIGSLRAGIVTLFPESFGESLWVSCASGGAPERVRLEGDFDHGASVSSLVSASAAFGATDGSLTIDDGRVALEVSWPPHEAAVLPLLTCRHIGARRFVRLSLSMGEIDETQVAGAPLRDLTLTLRARRSS